MPADWELRASALPDPSAAPPRAPVAVVVEQRCWGSGEVLKIVNPNWPSGDGEFLENTGDECPGCEDCEGHGA